MDEDCKQRYRDYQELLGEDYVGIMLNEPKIAYEDIVDAQDIIRVHALGIKC